MRLSRRTFELCKQIAIAFLYVCMYINILPLPYQHTARALYLPVYEIT